MAKTIRNFPFNKKDFAPEFVIKFKRGHVNLSLFEKGVGVMFEFERIWQPKTKRFVKKILHKKLRRRINKESFEIKKWH
jgi:hypothetical protein